MGVWLTREIEREKVYQRPIKAPLINRSLTTVRSASLRSSSVTMSGTTLWSSCAFRCLLYCFLRLSPPVNPASSSSCRSSSEISLPSSSVLRATISRSSSDRPWPRFEGDRRLLPEAVAGSRLLWRRAPAPLGAIGSISNSSPSVSECSSLASRGTLSPRGVPVACPRAEDADGAADRVRVTDSVVVVVVGGRLSRGSGRRCDVGVVSARGGLDIVQGEMHHCSIVDWTVATLVVQARPIGRISAKLPATLRQDHCGVAKQA